MASILKIPSPLRRFTNGESSIEVNGNSINKVLEELLNAHPDIKGHLVEEDGNLRNFVNIFLNGFISINWNKDVLYYHILLIIKC